MSGNSLGAMDTPRAASSRIDALDALRGLAVLGIFVDQHYRPWSMPEIAFSQPEGLQAGRAC